MSAKNCVGVGVIGLGFMGRTHIAAYEEARRNGLACRLVGVCDRHPERRAGRLGSGGNIQADLVDRLFDPADVRAYERFDDLIADREVDLVSVCTHTDTHVDFAVRALAAGEHVLVENPIALRACDVKRLVETARATSSICMPAMCMRFWPGWSWLNERIEDGGLGAVHSAAFWRLGQVPDWAPHFYGDESRSGGAVVDLHIHDVDSLYWCFGTPRALTSVGTANHIVTLFRYTSVTGPVVAEAGWFCTKNFEFRMKYRVAFEGGTAEFDSRRECPLQLVREGRTETIPLQPDTGYNGEVRHILERIQGKRWDLDAPIEDGLMVARLLDAERQSLAEATWVRLE